MVKRSIIKIDEDKCNGCGLCVPSCAEGAIQVIDGKARLVSEVYCDGLGACLGECPMGALTIEEREAEEFDEEAAMAHVKATRGGAEAGHGRHHAHHAHGQGCPGSRMMVLQRSGACSCPSGASESEPQESALGQWPVQLALVSPSAPYFKDADLLITADCVPFAMPDYHAKFLRGRAVVVGCPKLDDTSPYVRKLADIISQGRVRSVTVLVMEVPCCRGMVNIAKEAAAQAAMTTGHTVPVREVTVSLQGEVLSVR